MLERPEMIKQSNEERDADRNREEAVQMEIMLTRTAAEWEDYLQSRHVPATRVRRMEEAVADPHVARRGVFHRYQSAPGIAGAFGVPLAAFLFAHDGPRIDAPPPTPGQHNDEILGELGYSGAEINELRAAGVI